MRANVLFLTFAAWAAASCGSNPKPPKGHRPDPADVRYDVGIWVEDDPRMPKALILAGCEAWSAKGVHCHEASDLGRARIRVYADDEACVDTHPDTGKPRTVLAWAHAGGMVRMMGKCLAMKGEAFDPHQLKAVMTHEVGHQLGIWDHVPYAPECKDAKSHPGGRKVCGPAIMNPHYNPRIDYVTEIDALAFDVRDHEHSVLIGDIPEAERPDCVYHGEP